MGIQEQQQRKQNDYRNYDFGIPQPVEIRLEYSRNVYLAADVNRVSNLILARNGHSDLRNPQQESHDFYEAASVGATGQYMGLTVPIGWGLLGETQFRWQKFWFATGTAERRVPFLSLRYWSDYAYETGMSLQRALTGASGGGDAYTTAVSVIDDGRLIANSEAAGRFQVAGQSLVRQARGAISMLLNLVDFGRADYLLQNQIVPNLNVEALLALSWFDGTAGEGTSTSNAIVVTQHTAIQEELVLSPRILFYLCADRIWKAYEAEWRERRATRTLSDIMNDLAHVFGNVWSTCCAIGQYGELGTKPRDPRNDRCRLPLDNRFGEHFFDLGRMLHPDTRLGTYLAALDRRDAYRQRTLEDSVWYRDIPDQWTCDPIRLHRYAS